MRITKKKYELTKMFINVYFTKYFLAVEIDEQNHEGRELIFETKRQEALEKKTWL